VAMPWSSVGGGGREEGWVWKKLKCRDGVSSGRVGEGNGKILVSKVRVARGWCDLHGLCYTTKDG